MITKYGDCTSGYIFYHGTSDIYLESILGSGIHPPSKIGVSPRSDRTTEVDMDCVYITRLHHIALEEATKKCQDVGGKPVVIAVRYTELDLVEDPEFPADTLYLEEMGLPVEPMCFKAPRSIFNWYILDHQIYEPVYLG